MDPRKRKEPNHESATIENRLLKLRRRQRAQPNPGGVSRYTNDINIEIICAIACRQSAHPATLSILSRASGISVYLGQTGRFRVPPIGARFLKLPQRSGNFSGYILAFSFFFFTQPHSTSSFTFFLLAFCSIKGSAGVDVSHPPDLIATQQGRCRVCWSSTLDAFGRLMPRSTPPPLSPPRAIFLWFLFHSIFLWFSVAILFPFGSRLVAILSESFDLRSIRR